jgi:SAM-dependent methyltransferase
MTDETMVSPEAAAWAIRLFIGREPVDAAEIEFHRGNPSIGALRAAFAQTAEFRQFLATLAAPVREAYRAPLALLVPPEDRRIPWRFMPPSLTRPTSQLCTSEQMAEPAYRRWAAALAQAPVQHRKLWEFCFIMAVLEDRGMTRPGCRGLGFGVGREPIPSLLAQHGVEVLATDAPAELVESQGWAVTGQHAMAVEALHHPGIVDAASFARLVGFRTLDMNDIPDDLDGFDFCWSSCAFEHLGSIERGLAFVENSLRPLKPGGIAVHTTEFNLSSTEDTIEIDQLSLFRKPDIEALLSRLIDAGHEVAPLNLYLGGGEIDRHVDLPPYALPHLKLLLDPYVSTSIGLVVRKAAPPAG